MRIEIRFGNVEPSKALVGHIERRIVLAIGRFRPMIERIAVRIDDIDAPRGPTYRQCAITMTLAHGAPIYVEHRDRCIEAAVDSATDRVGRHVARLLELQRLHGVRASHRTGPASGLLDGPTEPPPARVVLDASDK